MYIVNDWMCGIAIGSSSNIIHRSLLGWEQSSAKHLSIITCFLRLIKREGFSSHSVLSCARWVWSVVLDMGIFFVCDCVYSCACNLNHQFHHGSWESTDAFFSAHVNHVLMLHSLETESIRRHQLLLSARSTCKLELYLSCI